LSETENILFYSSEIQTSLMAYSSLLVKVYLLQFLMKLSCKALHGKGAQHDRNLNPHTKKTNFHTSQLSSPLEVSLTHYSEKFHSSYIL